MFDYLLCFFIFLAVIIINYFLLFKVKSKTISSFFGTKYVVAKKKKVQFQFLKRKLPPCQYYSVFDFFVTIPNKKADIYSIFKQIILDLFSWFLWFIVAEQVPEIRFSGTCNQSKTVSYTHLTLTTILLV